MKLYLSSIEVPTPDDLAELIGKPLSTVTVAVIPNAKDYYNARARRYKNEKFSETMQLLGLRVETVDLLSYNDAEGLRKKLQAFDLIWARGGNTFCLRHAMRRSGFDQVVGELLESGVVYGGDSAGALVAGLSIEGIESADIPEFAEEVINDGLQLVPFVVLPHVDNADFAEAVATVKSLHKGKHDLIELKDNQAVIFDSAQHRIVAAAKQ